MPRSDNFAILRQKRPYNYFQVIAGLTQTFVPKHVRRALRSAAAVQVLFGLA